MSPKREPVPTRADAWGDLPVAIEARIGDRMMDLSEIGRLEVGSVVASGRSAGETVDVYAGNVRLASAEVVVIKDRLALRITQFDGLAQ